MRNESGRWERGRGQEGGDRGRRRRGAGRRRTGAMMSDGFLSMPSQTNCCSFRISDLSDLGYNSYQQI